MAEIDFLILANHAEVVNGLLYLSGGGWAQHIRPGRLPGPVPFMSTIGVAAGVRIPWGETNVQHALSITLEDADGTALAQVQAGVTAGRSPSLPQGSDQLANLAMNVSVHFPKPGEYQIVARMGAQARTVAFRVLDQPVAQLPAA